MDATAYLQAILDRIDRMDDRHMTRRDMFSLCAMEGLLSGEADLGCGPFASRQQWREKVASEAVALADAVLAKLAENGGDKQGGA